MINKVEVPVADAVEEEVVPVAVLKFYDEGAADGHIQMSLDLPHDYDPESLRPFEVAALMVVQYIEKASEGFESIKTN